MIGPVRQFIHRLRPASGPTSPSVAAPEPELSPDEIAIRSYLENGRKPWSHGYTAYRDRFVAAALRNRELMHLFRTGAPLPRDYGFRLDERVVVLPWALAHLADCGLKVFDAGGALNQTSLLQHPVVEQRTLIIGTLSSQSVPTWPNVAYLHDELCQMVVRDACMDVVTCLGTLGQIGMGCTMLLPHDQAGPECDPTAHRPPLHEFRRLLRSGGVLLLTVPFGQRENHGRTRQFDRAGVEDIVKTFGGRLAEWRCYRYLPGGWRTALSEECADCRYFDIHATPQFGPDYAAAARAVACLRLVLE